MSDQQGAAPAEQGPVIYKGLAGVPVDYTAISKVNSDTNSLLYRGYPVHKLTSKSATSIPRATTRHAVDAIQ